MSCFIMIYHLNVKNNSLASWFVAENPSGLAQNLGTVVKESDTDVDVDAQLKNMVL
jgi:hypothetical protein